MAAWARQLQSAEARRSVRYDPVTWHPAAAALTVYVWLCQAGACQFSRSPLATTRHGAGRCSGTGHKHRARCCRGSSVPRRRLSTHHQRTLVGGKPVEFIDY